MKKLILFMLIPLFASSCNSLVPQAEQEEKKESETGFELPSKAPELSEAELGMSDAVSSFGLDLFWRLLQEKGTESFMISPMGLSLVLSMDIVGATGETESQLKSLIGFDGQKSEAVTAYYKNLIGRLLTLDELVTFRSANAVWAQDGFPVKNSYTLALGKYFDASSFNVDFLDKAKVLKEINDWASDKTEGTIRDMLKEAPEGPLVLANALYFKSSWGVEFEEGLIDAEFHGCDGDVPCKFFKKTGAFKYDKNDGYRLLSIPYGKGFFEMVLVLPDEGVGIDEAVLWMKESGLAAVDRMNSSPVTAPIEVRIPCYTINSSFGNIKDVLADMGAPVPFSNNADYSGISDMPLFVDKILQNTYIDVNEKGTVSSAVTVEIMYGADPESEPDAPELFCADRPFIFIIRETGSRSNVFIGVKQ